MAELQRVENGLSYGLELKDMNVHAGINAEIGSSIVRAESRHAEKGGHVIDIAADVLGGDGYLHEGTIYTLGRRATGLLLAVASFTHEDSPLDKAKRRLDYKDYSDEEGEPCDLDDLRGFLNSIHAHIRGQIRPYYLQQKGAIWTAIAKNALAADKKRTMSALHTVGYEFDGVSGMDIIMTKTER